MRLGRTAPPPPSPMRACASCPARSESSNVNAVEALVNMITLARQYEAQIKLMRNASDNDAASAQTLRMY